MPARFDNYYDTADDIRQLITEISEAYRETEVDDELLEAQVAWNNSIDEQKSDSLGNPNPSQLPDLSS